MTPFHDNFRIAASFLPTIRESTSFVVTSAFHRTNVEFGKHWLLSAVA